MPTTRHVRTRTGCWTCRFRKKKCDEARPACEQCSHLKLVCDGYNEQPPWMKDEESAKLKKEEIKSQMVRRSRRRKRSQMVADGHQKKKTEVSNPSQRRSSAGQPVSPPLSDDDYERQHSDSSEVEDIERHDLCVSTATSSEHTPLPSPTNVSFDTNTLRSTSSYTTSPWSIQKESNSTTKGLVSASNRRDPFSSPTRIQNLDDDEDMNDCAESSSSPSTLSAGTLSTGSLDDQALWEKQSQSLTCSTNAFLGVALPTSDILDHNLTKLYFNNVFGVTYRALSDKQVVKYQRTLIVPMFLGNKSFYHGCISSSALHSTTTSNSVEKTRKLMALVYKHRQRSLSYLNKQVAIASKDNYSAIAATVCALVSFEVYSQTAKWSVHVKAATDCVRMLNWCNQPPTEPGEWFVFCRIIWLDIISTLTTRKEPYFMDVFRKMLFLPPEHRGKYRLVELTGCQDTVMYLLAEVSCLDVWKAETFGKHLSTTNLHELHRRGALLEEHLLASVDHEDLTPPPPLVSASSLDEDEGFLYASPTSVSESSDHFLSRRASAENCSMDVDEVSLPQVPVPQDDASEFGTSNKLSAFQEGHTIYSDAVTTAFRTAARLHLATIVYGFVPSLPHIEKLLNELINIIALLPSGIGGYDRSIVAPLLIGGSLAHDKVDREFFLHRLRKVPQLARHGNLGTIDVILNKVWEKLDRDEIGTSVNNQIPWRQVMIDNDWEYLLV